MPELDSLKEKKEELFGQKQGLLDQRKDAMIKMRAIRAEISAVKSQRNQFNQLVQENKKRRSAADTKIKQLSNEIQALRQSQASGQIPGRAPEIEKKLKGLEWRYQTQALTPAEDKKMSRQIQELTMHLGALKERDKAKNGLFSKSQEIGDIQKEQKIFHLNVLTNAERSEAKHQELMSLYKRTDELKAEKEKLDGQLGPISDKISEIKGALRKEFDDIKADKEKETSKVQARQDKLLDEKAKAVKEKIKNGKKLTTQDILIIQQADIDI